jgi:hypothetical protein
MTGLDEHQAAAVAAQAEPMAKIGAGAGTPLDQLYTMADELRKGTALTREQAFARVVETPAGMALYKADKEWRLGVCQPPNNRPKAFDRERGNHPRCAQPSYPLQGARTAAQLRPSCCTHATV